MNLKSKFKLIPNLKAKKFRAEIKIGKKIDFKNDEPIVGKKLTNGQKKYRFGYLQSRIDMAKLIKSKKTKK